MGARNTAGKSATSAPPMQSTIQPFDVTKLKSGYPCRTLCSQPVRGGFNWSRAASSANDYYNVGKVLGAGGGCYVGGLITIQTGGWGCLVGGPTGAVVIGVGAAIWGFFMGGYDTPTGSAFEGAPDLPTGFEYNR